MKCPHVTKSKIAPDVRAKLEANGVDAVRSKLSHIMSVTRLDQPGGSERLGDNLSATREEMQEWLAEKAACDKWWVIVAAVAAVVAAVAAVIAAIPSVIFFFAR